MMAADADSVLGLQGAVVLLAMPLALIGARVSFPILLSGEVAHDAGAAVATC